MGTEGLIAVHIGYLVQQYPPEVGAGPARVREMALRWVERGARVTVFTAMPNRPEGRIHAPYRGKLVVEEDDAGIRVLRSWLYASPKHGFARTLLNNITFMASSAAMGVTHGAGLDVLIASSPPFFPHISGAIVAATRRCPLVLELRDLWPDYLVGMGVLREGSLPARGLFALERGLLARADHVTVVTPSFKRRIIGKGVAAEDIEVRPNGVDVEFYRPVAAAPPLDALRRRSADELLVGYLGNFGAGQSLGTLVDVASILAKECSSIRLVLVGDGPDGARIRECVQSRGLKNIEVQAPIVKALTPAFYAACDLCLVPLAPIAVFQETVPSKIFEIMACERPVIASLDGEGRAIVEQSGGGWVVPPGDAPALAAAIQRFADTTAEERASTGRAGRAYVGEHYARASVADAYLASMERVIAARSGRP